MEIGFTSDVEPPVVPAADRPSVEEDLLEPNRPLDDLSFDEAYEDELPGLEVDFGELTFDDAFRTPPVPPPEEPLSEPNELDFWNGVFEEELLELV